ncbi:hypothetical protein BUALT_Bualt05G0100600 [Buddleja alternifolia]|uniref:Cytochrome b561 domain-containing protein n=1 Tax=Buddleja alternifolia TaxID=168488 RepID=A0AAV6XPU4_9LAMI|nr:hypothetical protein BUALT_Bualt05G0100600 [Buddleja alternifolia]
MDPLEAHRTRYRRPASLVTIVAHFFGVLAVVLLLVWLLHYREGIDLDSDNPNRIFNVHPFLMFFGFIFVAGEAMMAYKTVGADRKVQKFIHMFLHLVAIVLGIVGLHAAFKFHDKLNITDMYSLHSWIGIGTFSLFCLQWLLGLSAFLLPGASRDTRARAAPWHISGGRALLFMAICAALTGLMQKAIILRLQNNHESRLINVLGLAILLFGVHPFLMLFGFIFMMVEAIMVYNTIPVERKVQNYVRAFLHFVAIVLGTVGFHASIKLHEKLNIASFTSLHSWIGISTISLFVFQGLYGLILFLLRGVPNEVHARAVPWHINGGRVVFYMAICAGLTGLMEKATSLQLHNRNESHLINFLGLTILLSGIFVDLSISLAHL